MTADFMELCSTAELIELFAEYTEADEQQKRECYLVSECRLMVDIDFADESLDRVRVTTVVVTFPIIVLQRVALVPSTW